MKTQAIDVVKNISMEDFKKNYLSKQRPLVIKGLTKDTEAGRSWNLDYICRICGEVQVDVYDNANPNKATAFTHPDLKMPFRDYLRSITRPEPSSLRMFLFNMFKLKPELRKDFPCPAIMRGVMGRVGFMFFGAKGIKVRIHQDMDFSNVLLTQFEGRKKVVLVEPRFSRLLYKLPFNTHSLVDLDQPDYEKYPALRALETQSCILEPGDSLFMPSGYWHYITYLDGGFAVSYRRLAIHLRWTWLGFLNLCIYMPFDKTMNQLIPQKWLAYKEQLAENRANKALQMFTKNKEQKTQFVPSSAAS
jgi:ribosomal protein L16 Arg81 hydroxylase